MIRFQRGSIQVGKYEIIANGLIYEEDTGFSQGYDYESDISYGNSWFSTTVTVRDTNTENLRSFEMQVDIYLTFVGDGEYPNEFYLERTSPIQEEIELSVDKNFYAKSTRDIRFIMSSKEAEDIIDENYDGFAKAVLELCKPSFVKFGYNVDYLHA